MILRMSRRNWERFETHGKKTTIRLKPKKSGIYDVYCGNRYKPERLGLLEIKAPMWVSKTVEALKESDAENDGFDSLCELLLELAKRNPAIEPFTTVHILPCRKLEEKAGINSLASVKLEAGGEVPTVGGVKCGPPSLAESPGIGRNGSSALGTPKPKKAGVKG